MAKIRELFSNFWYNFNRNADERIVLLFVLLFVIAGFPFIVGFIIWLSAGACREDFGISIGIGSILVYFVYFILITLACLIKAAKNAWKWLYKKLVG
jgi:hypothetical protein